MTTIQHNLDQFASGSADVTPIDAHAHYYPVFGRRQFLSAAAANMAAVAGSNAGAAGILMLAEPRQDGDPLEAWRAPLVGGMGWTIEPTAEETSLIARRANGAAIVLIAGRQLVTTEGLEVLALATCAEFLIQRPLRDLLDQVRMSGGLPVIPWGFGKWWGGRGRLVLEVIGSNPRGQIFLGDNGCRPASARQHPAFRVARHAGVPVLPGSDPLPMPSHAQRAGSFGALVPGRVDQLHPAMAVRAWLLSLRSDPEMYGQRTSAFSFILSQFSLRTARRRRMLQQQSEEGM